MQDRALVRGLFLMVIAVGFGLQSLRYPMGRIEMAGPGLFPLIVSSLVLLIGMVNVVRSRFAERARIQFSVRNIGIIIGSLVVFALLSQYVNMIVAIVVMVFCASLAAPTQSLTRNVAIAAGLIVIAFMFQRLLGLELNLY